MKLLNIQIDLLLYIKLFTRRIIDKFRNKLNREINILKYMAFIEA